MTPPSHREAADGALFRVRGDRAEPTELTRGPWDPRALHGGPVAALLARAVERHDAGPADHVVRLSLDLLRPVPLAPLLVHVRTTRPGRSVQWLEAGLSTEEGLEVARAVALRMRRVALPTPEGSRPRVDLPRDPHAVGLPTELGSGWGVGYWTANELREVEGSFLRIGPGTVWLRLLVPVVEGEEPTGLQRVAAAADFGSGIGNPVGTATLAAINADLSIHLHRHPPGEWVGLGATGWASDDGVGMVETRIFDERGPLGRAAQSLLVHRRA